ncbi:MAG: thiamine phosphate synthase [Bacteroidota bacterium]
MKLGRLHILTDYTFQQRHAHAELAAAALAGGADTIQFRQKRGLVRHILHEARATAAVCRAAGAPLIVDDYLDVALALGVGVHLGQEDFPALEARTLLGPDALLGVTATTLSQARAAEAAGATYVGFGPVFPTSSKANPASVKGLAGLAAACEAVSIPIIAIGGLVPSRVRAVLEAGAYGLAVMTAVSTAPNPTAATRRFRTALDRALG